MKRTSILVVCAIILAVLAGLGRSYVKATASRRTSEIPKERRTAIIAAPGRIEPISEEISIGAEIKGKLKEVSVEEGMPVRSGQIIAILSDDDYRARLASAEAELQLKEAELRRTVNGSRDQERREAWALVQEAEAVAAQTCSEALRRERLFASGIISRSESEQAQRECETARARLEAARERHGLIDAPAREEERSRAEADVALARARVEEARSGLAKTIIRSPIEGIVLRKYVKAGESVSEAPETRIVTLGDASVWRVRVDVDETDIDKVRPGQRAYVTATAFGDQKFWGRVVRLGQMVGKKNIRTEKPAERTDTNVMETLIELDDARSLRAGLRVDACLLVDEK